MGVETCWIVLGSGRGGSPGMVDILGGCPAGLGLKVLGPGEVELFMNGVGAYVGRFRADDPEGAGVTGVDVGGMNS